MSNLESTRGGARPVSKPVAIACALAITVLAFAGAALMKGAGVRSAADAEIVGWIDPLRIQANDVERDVTAADRFLRLYIMQGRPADAAQFEKTRARVGDDITKLTATAQAADPEARDAATAFADAVKKWLDLAGAWYQAARSESVDASRAAVLARIGPDDPLENMVNQRRALALALDDALAERRSRAAEDEQASGRRIAAWAVLLALAAILAHWLAWRAARSTTPGVDLGLMRAVLDQLPDAVAIFGGDGRVIVSNLAAARAVESADGGLGRLALFDENGETVPGAGSPLALALAGQHVLDRELFTARLDGSLAPVEVHAEPILENGRATAAVVVMRDKGEVHRVEAEMEALADAKAAAEIASSEVSRRLRVVEAELAEARAAAEQARRDADTARRDAEAGVARLERLASDGGAVGVAVFAGADMRLREANQHALEMFGERRREHDVRGSTLAELAPGAEASGLLDLFRKVAAAGETYASEEYFVQGLRNGDAYWRFTLVPLGPEPHAPADELMLLGVDVTADVERRAAAAGDVGHGGWTIEDVLLAISNDLRTPILSIQGMVGLFRQKYAEAVPDVTALHYLELTQRNADQIATLIDDLVALSSLGREELQTSEIPLAAAIEEAWRASPRQGVELRVAGPLPTVRADRAKLMRAFRDLFDTAAHLRRPGEGAWVHVRVHDLGAMWEIELTDNGSGVRDEAEGERLFGPLARHAAAAAPNGGGQTLIAGGLGLAAVRRIAQLHGGAATVALAPEGGTRYSFTIDK